MAMSRSFGGTELTTRWSILTSPSVTLSSPAMMASKVDLPQPEGPTRTTNSPVLTSRSIPLSTGTEPKFFLRCWIVSEAIDNRLFECPLSEPAQKISAAEQINQERRQSANQNGGALNVVLVDCGPSAAQRDQCSRNRLVGAGGKNDREKELVPDVGELPDHGDNYDRGGQM